MTPTMQPESSEAVIKRICRALSRADGFALYFVLVNLPSARRAFARQVIEQLERPVIELDVPAQGFGDTTLDGWLLPQMEGAPAESAIFLHGLDHAMPNDRVGLRRFLQQLNWRRGALASVGRPLVIWLPRYALDNMAEHAPDLYDWYSNVYEFASPAEEAEELQSSFYTEFNTDVHPANRQSKAEKEQWLRTLTALLDEHPQRNAYRAKLLGDAGMMYKALGHLEDALALCQQSLAIRRESGDRKGEGMLLNNIGTIYHVRGDYTTALTYLDRSLDIRKETGDRKGEGATLSNISQIYSARGDYATALGYLERSLAIRQEIGDKKGEASTLNSIGQIYKKRGDYDKALNYLEQSLDIARAIGDRAGEDCIRHNIGGIYHAEGNTAKALQCYEQSLTIQQEIGNRYGEAMTSWSIGLTLKKQGDLSKAESYISRAVQLAELIGHSKLGAWRKTLAELRAEMKGR
ncbi:MAG: tetratricopeptide repeat protein [Candidatus Electrothrix scaldis]|nr:MAG: tetratricopeptide repeat protein [Candidatus Electrothrix sp. GW3-3]